MSSPFDTSNVISVLKMNFNVNQIKTIAQNSKKCSKFVYRVLYNDGLCAPKIIRHASMLCTSKRTALMSQISVYFRSPQRCYCEQSGPPTPSQKLPPLMNIPMVAWPSIFKSLKNLILTTFIIKPYFDNEFSLPDFVTGSKKAVEVVSHRLSEGQDLEGLVTPDIIPTLKDTISKMSLGQRDLIPVDFGDIYFTFPYQIGIIFNQDDPTVQKRFVEITMVYHVMKGLSAMRAQGEEPPMSAGLLPEFQDRLSICNYRFIKEFTKGVDSDWTVNLLNHFRPIDDEF